MKQSRWYPLPRASIAASSPAHSLLVQLAPWASRGQLMLPRLRGTTWLTPGSLKGSIYQTGPMLVPTPYRSPW